MREFASSAAVRGLLASFLFCAINATAQVEVRDSHLYVDGQKEPQLFGAEVQYFRMRGGYGRNVPRAKVLALWAKALDRVVEAKMNAISFYIPWDFHEYAEGKFDFTGTVDEDGDGNPDYPSRDVLTFMKMASDRGIKRIMVRPGPYINAEWGYLGFGAIPSWFHEKYPDSHMMTPWGWRHPLHDYLNPDFLRHTRLWYQAVYDHVLHDAMGPGRPVMFVQIDNETNYQWQSIYQSDYSPRAQMRYRNFLKARYATLADLNVAHARSWGAWDAVRAPEAPGTEGENRDWYAFCDATIGQYLHELRLIWEQIGVREPNILFTLAESYNAPAFGLLPNYVLKNQRGMTGLMTVNLYPKTAPGGYLNQPFKADLDVKSATEAGNSYLGTRGQEWAMGPEVQGGWWAGTDVTDEARQQTYLTVLGHGLKAFFVYYFNEGQNWGVEWSFEHVKPIFDQLRVERQVENVPVLQLDNAFWGELQARSDRMLVTGLPARQLMEHGGPLQGAETLFFDAPLDHEANPRGHYDVLKRIGEKVIAPHQSFLARALEVTDELAFVKDSVSHQPTAIPGIDSALAESDWSGGLIGLFLNSGFNPQMRFADLNSEGLERYRALVHIDTGVNAVQTLASLKAAVARKQTVINLLHDDVSRGLGLSIPRVTAMMGVRTLDFYVNSRGQLVSGREPDAIPKRIVARGPIFTYDLTGSQCEGILFWQGQTVGYRCGSFTQIGAEIFGDYNSDAHSTLTDANERREFVRAAFSSVTPKMRVEENTGKLSAFARRDPLKKLLWITVKTGSAQANGGHISLSKQLLSEAFGPGKNQFQIQDLLSGRTLTVSDHELTGGGFAFDLRAFGSTVFVVEPTVFVANEG